MSNSTFGISIRNLWLLDEDITFLNNGSFGAAPIKVIEAAERIQRRLEREPVSFFVDGFADELRQSIGKLADFIGSNPENLVLVDNATSGVNVVLRSLLPKLKPDDEIIINNHTYPAVKSACHYLSEITGCKIIEIKLPYPVESNQQIVEVYKNALNDKTRLVILDHIVFTTGLVNPVKEIAKIVKENGSLILVDGAHAPGMINLNIEELDVDWYTGNCHKWLFAPKGCALLWTSPEHQSYTKPLSISFFHNQGYTAEFDWTGTKNPVPFLALSDAVDFHNELGSEEIFSYIHNLAIEGRNLVANELGLSKDIPEEMLGSLAAFELPGDRGTTGHEITSALRKRFFEKYKIEMPFVEFDGKIFFRFSAQVFNEISDYEKLVDALMDFLEIKKP